MANKPLALPEWATGGAIVEPPSGKKTSGWIGGEQPPAEYLNWLQNLQYQWVEYVNDPAQTANNLALLDAQAKLPLARQHNAILSITDIISDGHATINFAVIGSAITGTSFVDIGAAPTYQPTIAGLEVGDIVMLDGLIHAKLRGAAGVKAFINLIVISPTPTNTTVQTITINEPDVDTVTDNQLIKRYPIVAKKFTVTVAGTHTIKAQGAVSTTSGSPTPSLQAEAPYHLRATVIRP